MSPLVWAVIAFLILVNALYVAAEFGAVGARRSRIRRLATAGNPLAGRLLPVLEDPRALDRYIAASQIGITLSSLVLGAYAQAALAPALEPYFARLEPVRGLAAETAAVTVVLIGLAGLQVVVGELVPKALALQYPTRTALLTVLPMQWSLHAFAWFIAVLNGSAIINFWNLPDAVSQKCRRSDWIPAPIKPAVMSALQIRRSLIYALERVRILVVKPWLKRSIEVLQRALMSGKYRKLMTQTDGSRRALIPYDLAVGDSILLGLRDTLVCAGSAALYTIR